jgi:hypothetical protein
LEILINELSLSGQFKDENDFFDSFDITLEIIKLIDILSFSLAKESMFFNVDVTPQYKLSDFLRLRTDRAKRMKRFLAKLSQNPPYWNETQKHCVSDKYYFNAKNISNTSLAESCERDKIVLSFKHFNFQEIDLEIKKNNSFISIYNLVDKSNFLETLLFSKTIEPLKYCQIKFENSNLDFSKIENGYGFDSLDNKEQEEAFLLAFNGFSKMSWEDIIKSDGLEYKQYSKPKKQGWFLRNKGLYSNIDIYKFRVTQKYRCFGYREKDKFFVLRFEIDHKISDNG